MPSMKVFLSRSEEIHLDEVATRKGLSRSGLARRAVQTLLASASSSIPAPEAQVDELERRNGQGKKIVAAYLSPPLANAVKKLSKDTGSSTSHVVRDLLRCELRRRGMLPNNSYSGGNAPTMVPAGATAST